MGQQTRRHRPWRYTGAGPWTYEVSERVQQSLLDAKQQNAHDLQRVIERGDPDAITQCRSVQEAITEALEEVAARNRAASKRMLWEHDQRHRRSAYVTAHYRFCSVVLRDARAGTLAPDWRNRLGAEHANADLPDVLRDTYTSVIDELTTLPPQPWEPYVAGGDWRAALDTWYRDNLDLQDLYYRERTAPRPVPSDAPA